MKQGLSLGTSYAVVSLSLRKRCQPWELSPLELKRIGLPCDSLEEICQARSLLLQGKHIVFDGLTDRDSLAELLFCAAILKLIHISFSRDEGFSLLSTFLGPRCPWTDCIPVLRGVLQS